MKLLKYILTIEIIILVVGFLLKIAHLPLGGSLLVLGGITFWLTSIINMIVSLSKFYDRWVSGFTAIVGFIVLGITFKHMNWPGRGIVNVVFTNLLFLFSIAPLIISYIKKTNKFRPILMFSMGLMSLPYLFRIMNWPGSMVMFCSLSIPAITIALYFIIKYLNVKKYVLFILSWPLFMLYTTSYFAFTNLQLIHFYRIRGVENKHISPKTAQRYAWYLYEDKQYDESEKYLKLAISNLETQIGKEEKQFYIDIEGKFDNDLKALQAKTWTKEQASNFKYK